MSERKQKDKSEKWDFSDYAFTITGILVVILLVVPEILEAQFGIRFLGGSLNNIAPELVEELEYGQGRPVWNLNRLRALSPLLFLLTTTIVFFKEAVDARKSGGYKGSMFTHTFASLFEEAIYMAITTIMVYTSVLIGAMFASWLAGPISWVLFVFLFPLVRKKSSNTVEIEQVHMPWFLLFLLALGITVEVITGAWIALPLSWLIICAVKCVATIRAGNHSIDRVFDMLYYAFSVVLMAVGISLDFWIMSWASFPIALFICWIVSKFGRFKKAG